MLSILSLKINFVFEFYFKKLSKLFSVQGLITKNLLKSSDLRLLPEVYSKLLKSILFRQMLLSTKKKKPESLSCCCQKCFFQKYRLEYLFIENYFKSVDKSSEHFVCFCGFIKKAIIKNTYYSFRSRRVKLTKCFFIEFTSIKLSFFLSNRSQDPCLWKKNVTSTTLKGGWNRFVTIQLLRETLTK